MDISTIANQFPILSREVEGKRLVYLDNAATTQKPARVIDGLSNFYKTHYANVHRGIHTLSNESSEMYEAAHERTAKFINATGIEEIIFTRNTTESVNVVAHGWGRKFLKKGDIIVLTEMEHHSNIVPWMMLKKERGIEIKWVPVTDDGLLDMTAFADVLTKSKGKVKLVAVAHVSNVLGTINPVAEICRMAHENGALCLVDAAQSVARQRVDVQTMDIDFLAFSSHKMYGPDAIGVLYVKKDILAEMDPFLGGGGMISRVTQDVFECADLPWRFEAGTPAIAEGSIFAEAISFIEEIGMEDIISHERSLMTYALDKLCSLNWVEVVGSRDPEKRLGVLSFTVDGVHPHDLSSLLSERGVAIRAGHHCAMPLHIRYKNPATARISFGVYNTKDDIDAALSALEFVRRDFMNM